MKHIYILILTIFLITTLGCFKKNVYQSSFYFKPHGLAIDYLFNSEIGLGEWLNKETVGEYFNLEKDSIGNINFSVYDNNNSYNVSIAYNNFDSLKIKVLDLHNNGDALKIYLRLIKSVTLLNKKNIVFILNDFTDNKKYYFNKDKNNKTTYTSKEFAQYKLAFFYNTKDSTPFLSNAKCWVSDTSINIKKHFGNIIPMFNFMLEMNDLYNHGKKSMGNLTEFVVPIDNQNIIIPKKIMVQYNFIPDQILNPSHQFILFPSNNAFLLYYIGDVTNTLAINWYLNRQIRKLGLEPDVNMYVNMQYNNAETYNRFKWESGVVKFIKQ